MQVGVAAVMGDCGSCTLLETGQTGTMVQGGAVAVMEVRKTIIWLETGRVLWRMSQRKGEWAEVKAWTGTGTEI